MAHATGIHVYERSGSGLRASNEASSPFSQFTWFVAVSGIAFLVPLVFSSVLDLQHDVYYLVYFAVTLVTLGAYVRLNEVDIRRVFNRSWKLSLLVGAASALFVVWSVLARLDSTPHPNGLYFAFEIAWRGAFYGIVDALLLSAFPGMVAWQLMSKDISGFGRRVVYGATTLALVLIITATYHLGYEGLRNQEGIRNPEIGNTAISLPVVVSANPLGSVVAHTSMHLAAVTHAYESEDRLPPQTFVDSD